MIRTARKVLDDNKLTTLPLMAGCGGAGSTREAIQYTQEAAKAGAECVLVISPGYYKFAFGASLEPLKQCKCLDCFSMDTAYSDFRSLQGCGELPPVPPLQNKCA